MSEGKNTVIVAEVAEGWVERLGTFLGTIGAQRPDDHPWVREARWLCDNGPIQGADYKVVLRPPGDGDAPDPPPNAIGPAFTWADGTVREWWVDEGDGPKVVPAPPAADPVEGTR